MIELMVVVAIIGALAALAVPNLGDMYKDYKLRSATMAMVGTLQNLKLRAIRENEECKILIELDSGIYQYTSFVDADDDNTVDAGELFDETVLDENLTLAGNVNDVFGFTSRGMPSNGNGTITINLTGGSSIDIIINTVGNIRVD